MKFERLALRILLIALAFFIGVAIARAADPYGYGAIGQANGSLVDKPGLWRHEGTPYTTDLQDMAFKGGLGLRFESGVFVEAGVVDPGSFGIESKFVSDHNYDPAAMRCKRECEKQSALGLNNDMLGGEAVVGYQHEFLGFFRPYAKVGIAGFSHQHSGTFTPYRKHPIEFSYDGNDLGQNFSGMVLAVAMGGGLCAPAARVEVCGDVTHYHYVATTANPLTDGLTISTAYLKVPFVGW